MNPIIFYCDRSKVSELARLLDYIYTKQTLANIVSKTIAPVIGLRSVMVESEDGTEPLRRDLHDWLMVSSLSSSASKKTLLMLLALILSDERNFGTWMSMQSAGMQQLWDRVVRNLMVPQSEADRLTGIDSRQGRRGYSSIYNREIRIKEAYPWFECETIGLGYYGSDTVHYLYLHRTVYAWVARHMLKSDFGLVKANDRVERVIFNAEAESLLHLPAIMTLFAQNILTTGKTKLLMKSTVKRLADMHMAPLPTPDGVDEPNLREQCVGVAAAIAHRRCARQLAKKSVDSPQLVKMVANELESNPFELFNLATCFLKGAKCSDNSARRVLWMLKMLVESLTTAGDNWIGVDGLMTMAVHYLDENIYVMTGCDRSAFDGNLTNIYTGQPVKIGDAVQQVGLPMLRALICLLAGIGLVELAAVSDRQDGAATPFDAFGAFRLTALGRYVYGLDDEYQPPQTDDEPSFEASDAHLLVRVLKPDSPYMPILRRMATDVGNNRWAFTSKSFLEGCATLADLNRQISTFEGYVCANPSQVWLEFFEALKQQVQPLKSEPLSHYRLYHVDPANKPLIALLDSDERLRQLIVRVEGCRLLVHNNDYSRFAARLRELGYLI